MSVFDELKKDGLCGIQDSLGPSNCRFCGKKFKCCWECDHPMYVINALNYLHSDQTVCPQRFSTLRDKILIYVMVNIRNFYNIAALPEELRLIIGGFYAKKTKHHLGYFGQFDRENIGELIEAKKKGI